MNDIFFIQLIFNYEWQLYSQTLWYLLFVFINLHLVLISCAHFSINLSMSSLLYPLAMVMLFIIFVFSSQLSCARGILSNLYTSVLNAAIFYSTGGVNGWGW